MPCNEDSLNAMFKAVDKSEKTTEVIRVNRAAFEDVCRCHLEHVYGFIPRSLLARDPRSNSTTVEVYRAKLWEILRVHVW